VDDPLEDYTLAQEVHVDPILAYYLTIYTPRFLIDHCRLFGDDQRADQLERLFTLAAERKRARDG
jgi:hypothetical protein